MAKLGQIVIFHPEKTDGICRHNNTNEVSAIITQVSVEKRKTGEVELVNLCVFTNGFNQDIQLPFRTGIEKFDQAKFDAEEIEGLPKYKDSAWWKETEI